MCNLRKNTDTAFIEAFCGELMLHYSQSVLHSSSCWCFHAPAFVTLFVPATILLLEAHFVHYSNVWSWGDAVLEGKWIVRDSRAESQAPQPESVRSRGCEEQILITCMKTFFYGKPELFRQWIRPQMMACSRGWVYLYYYAMLYERKYKFFHMQLKSGFLI